MQKAEAHVAAGESGPTIALVEWNWMGHHPQYFAIFANALADIGATVVPWLPRPDDFGGLLASTACERSPERSGQILPPQAFANPGKIALVPHGVGRRVNQLVRFQTLRRQLRAWERRTGRTIDLVFFACMYEADFDFAGHSASRLLGYDWAGLYLQAKSIHAGKPARAARMFSDSRMRGIAVLEQAAIEPLQRLTAGKPIVRFPEPVDVSLPAEGDSSGVLANKMRNFAAGRKIVSLVGHLQRSKGLEVFTQAARDPRLSHLFFFLAGELYLGSMPPEVARAILKAWESTPNLLAHLIGITEQKTFNSVLINSDVIFAAYIDFPYSSNVLVKAAALGRPLIASSGFLMGNLVESHRLGVAVPQGDVEAVVQAILRLTGSPASGAAATADQSAADADLQREFSRLHSHESLRDAFRTLLASALPASAPLRAVAPRAG